MSPQFIYVFVFIILLALVIGLQLKYPLLKDDSDLTAKQPYSFARTQLVWWTFIILASFISIVIVTGQIPALNSSALILLGIGSLTTVSAKIIDMSDESNAAAAVAANTTPVVLSKNMPGENFFLDILSDKKGVSIHRLQAVVFNIVFGLWFIYRSFEDIGALDHYNTATVINPTLEAFISGLIPVISQPDLILLGLSAGTYAALKTTENK